jgi:hypothetical protein
MKKKNERVAFGIFKDGLSVKIAQLIEDENSIKIVNLKETILSYPLYPKELAEQEQKALNEDLEIPEIEETDEENMGFEAEETTTILSGMPDFQKLVLSFPIEQGIISLNADDNQISYHQFDAKFTSGKLMKRGDRFILNKEGLKALQLAVLTKEEIKTKKGYKINYIVNSDKTMLAWVYRGESEMLKALQQINQTITKKKFHFGFLDPNEISLMNIVRRNYNFEKDEYSLILYIGIDYKVGIVMQGKDHVKTFPIIITDSKPANMRRAIFSKVTLEQDLSHIHFTQNIILAGEYIKDEDVAYFVLKFSYRSKVTRLEINTDKTGKSGKPIEISKNSEGEITSESIARFAIPISLAWKSLRPKDKNFYNTNLIPEIILLRQKPFKIDWHGYVILATIFYFAYSGTISNMRVKHKIRKTIEERKKIEQEIKSSNELKTKLEAIKKDLSALELTNKKLKSFIGNKNQWSDILKTLSTVLSTMRYTWIQNLESAPTYFEVEGFSTNKKSIIKLSETFPKGTIKEIRKMENNGVLLWNFKIKFGYPNK